MAPNLKGALLMMGSMAAFTINDTCVKATGGELPLFQLLAIRGFMSLVLIFGLSLALGLLDLRLSFRDWLLVVVRGASEVAAAYFFLTALLNMPLANVTAVLQVLPLTVTLGAALFFGEAVGWRRLLAIVIGFAGMLVIVRPGPEGFNVYAGYVLAAVLCVTLRDLVTRRVSGRVSSLTVTFVSSVMVFLCYSLASTTVEWAQITPRLWTLLAGSAVFVTAAYLLSVAVMRVGDVSFVAPFRYTGILWALVLGFFVFGDWPDAVTLGGVALVVGSGLFMLYRERVRLRG